MGGEPATGDRRPVLIGTSRGCIQGCLTVHPGVRTLDWLNLHPGFVPIEALEATWSFEPGPLGINRERILFVAELDDDPPAIEARVEASHYSREAVALRVEDYDVRGYLHVRGIQDPSVLLSRSHHEFIALTSASVLGCDLELAARFLAVNPSHVLGVRPLAAAEDLPELAGCGDAATR